MGERFRNSRGIRSNCSAGFFDSSSEKGTFHNNGQAPFIGVRTSGQNGFERVIRKLYGERTPHLWVGVDETMMGKVSAGEYTQILFAAMSLDPRCRLKDCDRGVKFRGGKKFKGVQKTWWNQSNTPYHTLRYCFMSGREAQGKVHAANFLDTLPHMVKQYMARLGNIGGSIRVFLVGRAGFRHVYAFPQ